ncbi:MAG: HAD-IIB family hydrolase [Bacteroidales bacterium]|nr:HAD-IIB family hydrolase [Bacteroidales bacterium]HRX30743.1 HAD-IIB family hydrolase [Tenuifilaceae bacterium]
MNFDDSIVVTDLDGSLLNDWGSYSSRDVETLNYLGEKGVIRVIATGRSVYSFSKVIPNDFPIDYLVFSSGAGVIKWSTKELVHTNELPAVMVNRVIKILLQEKIDFMLHDPIPLNHCFQFYKSGNNNPDFERRINVYQDYASPLIVGVDYPDPASQFVAILPKDYEDFNRLRQTVEICGVKVIRATSPLDGESIWMEVFPKGISKASGIRFIRDLSKIEDGKLVVIGNDFNDIDMLDIASHPFVVDNAPNELKDKYMKTLSNNASGFSNAVTQVFNF